jgi:hypothetical protein
VPSLREAAVSGDKKAATRKPRRRRRAPQPSGKRERIQAALDARIDELAQAFRRGKGRP